MHPIHLANQLTNLLNESGYFVEIDSRMDRLMTEVLHAEGKKASNPEFDPALHDLSPGKAFWIRVRTGSDSTAAFIAGRLIETRQFLEFARSYRLWYGDKIIFTVPLQIVVDHDVQIPNGRIVFDGAMWVHPNHRGRGLSWAVGRLLRAIATDKWDPDWIFGLAYRGISQTRLPLYSYGYPRLDHFADGFWHPGYCPHELNLATITRQEICDQVIDDSAYLSDRPGLRLDRDFADSVRMRAVDIAALERPLIDLPKTGAAL